MAGCVQYSAEKINFKSVLYVRGAVVFAAVLLSRKSAITEDWRIKNLFSLPPGESCRMLRKTD
jgi:hypothetical protein